MNIDALAMDPFALPALVILIALASTAIWDGMSRIRVWEYGVCRGRRARRCKRTGEVQFILWKAGEQDHREDFWHPFNSYWWNEFSPAPEPHSKGPRT